MVTSTQCPRGARDRWWPDHDWLGGAPPAARLWSAAARRPAAAGRPAAGGRPAGGRRPAAGGGADLSGGSGRMPALVRVRGLGLARRGAPGRVRRPGRRRRGGAGRCRAARPGGCGSGRRGGAAQARLRGPGRLAACVPGVMAAARLARYGSGRPLRRHPLSERGLRATRHRHHDGNQADGQSRDHAESGPAQEPPPPARRISKNRRRIHAGSVAVASCPGLQIPEDQLERPGRMSRFVRRRPELAASTTAVAAQAAALTASAVLTPRRTLPAVAAPSA